MRCCRCKSRSAFTLLEVVVGLTLMASVLVSSLLAFSAHQKQRRLADAKIVAVRLADQLLTDLSVSRGGIPEVGGGIIAGSPNWFWRTSIVGTASPAGIPVKVIRFEVAKVKFGGGIESLASVDLVERIEP